MNKEAFVYRTADSHLSVRNVKQGVELTAANASGRATLLLDDQPQVAAFAELIGSAVKERNEDALNQIVRGVLAGSGKTRWTMTI